MTLSSWKPILKSMDLQDSMLHEFHVPFIHAHTHAVSMRTYPLVFHRGQCSL